MNTIKEWLKANRRSVSYLADVSGISRQALDSIIKRKSTPSIPTLAKISKSTGIPVEDMAREISTERA